jgi:hypothetical protein
MATSGLQDLHLALVSTCTDFRILEAKGKQVGHGWEELKGPQEKG